MGSRRVTLTFDNGPTPGVTERVLEISIEKTFAAPFLSLVRTWGLRLRLLWPEMRVRPATGSAITRLHIQLHWEIVLPRIMPPAKSAILRIALEICPIPISCSDLAETAV